MELLSGKMGERATWFESRTLLALNGSGRKERLMDIATFVGLIASVLLLVGMAGNGLAGMYAGMALLCVAVGGFAATLISLPLYRIATLPGVFGNVFFWTYIDPAKLIERMVEFAETARREGILGLEKAIEQKDDPFLAQGLRLAVDGTNPDLIMDILETELKFIEERHQMAQEAIGVLARNWTLFGGLAALIALVQQAGAGASGTVLVERAALPLFYGGVLTSLIGLPSARKLKEYSAREMLVKRMIIEGIMAIQSGDNPRIVEHKLSVFLAPRLRPSSPAPQPSPPARDAEKEKAGETPPAPSEEPSAGSATSASSQAREEEESPSPPEKQPAESAPRAPAPRTGEEEAKLEIEQVDLMLRLVREALERHAVDAERMSLIDQMIDRVVEEKLVMFSLFSLLGEEIGEEVLAALEKEAPQLVDQVRSQGGWFDFDDLAGLNDRDTQRLLREVEQKHLIIALLMASDGVKNKMLGNMSERVRNFIRQEMRERAQVSESEVRGAQGRIILQAIQLQRQGEISGVEKQA